MSSKVRSATSDLANNQASVLAMSFAAITTVPDVVVSSVTAPASVVQGSALAFTYVALNQGSASTGAHYAGISFDTQPSETNYRTYNTVGALGAYGSQTLSNSISTAGLSVGTHTLYIMEDFYGNAVSESNEANNVKSVTFTVTAPVATTVPDLVVSSITAPASVVQGSALAFSYVALNQGSASAGSHYAGISFDAQPTSSSFLTYNAVGALGANGSQTLTNSLSTAGLSVGTHTLYIMEDFYGNAVAEGNEANNVKAVTFSVTAPVSAGGFNITLNFTGDQTYAPYFNQAKAIWERVITGDLPDYAGVDDLVIAASVVYIDGAYGTLGQAGPTGFRTDATHLPYRGTMEFDSADMARMLADGRLVAVITHEMGHVLGFGSFWDSVGLNATFGQYTGAAALREYRTLSGNPNANYVPLETTGGTGTANAHWSEAIFKSELMTGYAESSGTMPLSRMTIASLQDLGYTVNYAAAESYTLPAALVGLTSAMLSAEALLIV